MVLERGHIRVPQAEVSDLVKSKFKFYLSYKSALKQSSDQGLKPVLQEKSSYLWQQTFKLSEPSCIQNKKNLGIHGKSFSCRKKILEMWNNIQVCFSGWERNKKCWENCNIVLLEHPNQIRSVASERGHIKPPQADVANLEDLKF